MIKDVEKKAYNTYLKTIRSQQNKPFKLRKNFDGFEKEEKYYYIKRIGNLFIKMPHVNMDDYFISPYKVYEYDPEAIYDLKFYSSLKAINCYKQYMKLKEMKDPDSEEQIEFIADSFKFILKFCMENKLTFSKYIHYKTGHIHEWMKHYIENKISLYSLFDNGDIFDIIMCMDKTSRNLLLGDLEKRFFQMKEKYMNSKKAKILVEKGSKLVRAKLANH